MAAAKETQERQAEEIETARPLCVGKKRSFDAAFKLKVVDCAEKSGSTRPRIVSALK